MLRDPLGTRRCQWSETGVNRVTSVVIVRQVVTPALTLSDCEFLMLLIIKSCDECEPYLVFADGEKLAEK